MRRPDVPDVPDQLIPGHRPRRIARRMAVMSIKPGPTSPATAWVVGSTEAGWRLDRFLAGPERLGSRGNAVRALERGKVLVNEQTVAVGDAGRRLATNDRVRVWMDRPGSARARFHRPTRSEGTLQIVYEDGDLVAVNKPAGLLTVPLASRPNASSVSEQLEHHFRSKGKRRPFPVHRIDRDTSGLVVFAVHAAAQQALKAQFEAREPLREYLAVVHGIPVPAAGEWQDVLAWDQQSLVQRPVSVKHPHARDCTCEYSVVEAFDRAALIRVRLVTGRRNQIRAQAQLHGHPLLGEKMYLEQTKGFSCIIPRQALHASLLTLRHPRLKRALTLEAPLPADLLGLLERLRKTPGLNAH